MNLNFYLEICCYNLGLLLFFKLKIVIIWSIFHIIFVNNDTHAKNFTFMMDRNCEWILAPAYDLTYAKAIGVLHPLATIKGKLKNYKREDFLYLGRMYRLNEKLMNEIIDETINKTLNIKEKAKKLDILDKNIDSAIMDIEDIVKNLRQ